MTIYINQQVQTVNEGSDLHSIVLSQLGEKQRGIAIAVNNKVIPKSERMDFILNDGDHVLIIKATQGG